MARGLGIVTARSGSKGFPGKNIAKLNGETLIELAVKVGLQATMLESVYVSTDSEEYETLALSAGAHSFGLRPKELSGDGSLTIDVLRYHLTLMNVVPDFIVLLQPTSPLRSSSQIDDCIRLHLSTGESVVSVSKLDEPHPYKLKRIVNGVLESFIEGARSDLPRQTLPDAYQLTGAIYVAAGSVIVSKNTLFSEKTQPYIVRDFANIDSELDLDILKHRIASGDVNIEC